MVFMRILLKNWLFSKSARFMIKSDDVQNLFRILFWVKGIGIHFWGLVRILEDLFEDRSSYDIITFFSSLLAYPY